MHFEDPREKLLEYFDPPIIQFRAIPYLPAKLFEPFAASLYLLLRPDVVLVYLWCYVVDGAGMACLL